MALSLILRSINKNQGYIHLFRGTSAFKITSNASFISNRATFNSIDKFSNKEEVNTLALPQVRNMSSSSDHRFLWTVEKALSVGLLGVLPLAIAAPNPLLDNVASIMVVLHLHWGLEAIAADYVRPIIFGNVIPTVAVYSVYVLTAITLGGLLYFNYSDIGVGKAIRKLWAIKN